MPVINGRSGMVGGGWQRYNYCYQTSAKLKIPFLDDTDFSFSSEKSVLYHVGGNTGFNMALTFTINPLFP